MPNIAPGGNALSTGIVTILLLAGTSFAQSPDPEAATGGNLETPTDWQVRLDYPSDIMRIGADEESDVFFVNMSPGWHIRTRPAAIFWYEASQASGNYRLEATFHLFAPDGRNEGYGIFFGAVNLDRDDITYDYFLVRNSGEYLIKGRGGTVTELLTDWTPSEEIRPFTDVTETSVENRLAVDIGAQEVVFEINGVEVKRLPRNQINTDGTFGLRVNHFLNLHVSSLSLAQHDDTAAATSSQD